MKRCKSTRIAAGVHISDKEKKPKKPRKFRFKPSKRADGDGPTNGTRAEWAEAGVYGFLEMTGEPGGTCEDSVTDLIADLLHLCDREGIDAEKVLERAKTDWEYER